MHSVAAFAVLAAPLAMAGAIQPRAAPTAPILSYIFPESRGSSVDTYTTGPCQGLPVMANRVQFPMSGGQVSLLHTRNAENVQIAYSTSLDPQSVSDFTPLLGNITTVQRGSSCIGLPDLSAFGLTEGQGITLKLEYQRNAGGSGGDGQSGGQGDSSSLNGNNGGGSAGGKSYAGVHYECADLTLVSPAAFRATGKTYTCEHTGLASKHSPEGAICELQANATGGSSSSSRLSSVASGGVGAGVALAVALAALGLAYFTGLVSFGKKRAAQRNAAMSDTQSIDTLAGTVGEKRSIA